MKAQHLPQELIDKMHKHCDKYYGCCPIQEQMMEILMDVVGFTLGEANNARKIVAKKQTYFCRVFIVVYFRKI